MVFFNYSTMQMAAKVVYYGPGLCGKTTNLQFIYGHTSQDSRGEMVSLETETDRTLFFDLLPIDVGSIAGFNTRIQLYTVPGQVFYNTTRKLVLKGVDGVVFVADSQRPMLQANLESLKNLQINLEEMNLTVDTMPIVLQYNKRDLPDVCTIEEMEQALNPHGWPSFGASAVTGQGVFETLKGISKLTLLNLKKRLSKPGPETSSQGRIVAVPAPAPARPAALSPASTGAAAPSSPPPGSAPVARPPVTLEPATQPLPVTRPAAAPAAKIAPLSPAARSKSSQVDVLAELEKIRRQAMHSPAAAVPHPPRAAAPVLTAAPAPPVASAAAPPAPHSLATPPPAQPVASGAHAKYPVLNGKGEIHRSVELTLKRGEFTRARRFLLNLRIEDEDRKVVEAIRDLPIEIQDAKSLERVLLQLNVQLKSKD
ncbi:MAG: GTPase domain-containing protein [Thermoanaerobaculia bacterium]|nr:GTPase domain-containing protein [Thermoanaerobaculia bacterium]